ncbi:MAG: hypothetical protein P8X74_00955 [Reinekea sp.]
MLPSNCNEPMGAPAIFEKQIEIKLLHSASTEEVTDSGLSFEFFIVAQIAQALTQQCHHIFLVSKFYALFLQTAAL